MIWGAPLLRNTMQQVQWREHLATSPPPVFGSSGSVIRTRGRCHPRVHRLSMGVGGRTPQRWPGPKAKPRVLVRARMCWFGHDGFQGVFASHEVEEDMKAADHHLSQVFHWLSLMPSKPIEALKIGHPFKGGPEGAGVGRNGRISHWSGLCREGSPST